jgi:hypothetical protein
LTGAEILALINEYPIVLLALEIVLHRKVDHVIEIVCPKIAVGYPLDLNSVLNLAVEELDVVLASQIIEIIGRFR